MIRYLVFKIYAELTGGKLVINKLLVPGCHEIIIQLTETWYLFRSFQSLASPRVTGHAL